MAEETDSTQKPKAQLIKHTQADHGSEKAPPPPATPAATPTAAPTANPAKSGERHKIVLKKKSPGMGAGAAANSLGGTALSLVKKLPKLVLSSHPDSKADSAGSREDENQDGASKTEAKGTSEETTNMLSSGNLPGTFSFAQRPAVVAGRVGGKPVGRKSHGDGVPQNRAGSGGSAGAAGKTAGRQSPSNFSNAPRQGGGRFGHAAGHTAHEGGRAGGFGPGHAAGHTASPHGGPRTGGAGRPGFAPRPGMGRGGGLGSPPPGPLPEGKTAKRTFKAKKPSYSRKEKELEMEEKLLQTKKKITYVANPVPKSIEIMEVISVSELAKKMNLKASDLIQKLMKMGMMVTINQQIDADTATILAGEFGADVKIISLYDETVIDTGTDEGAEMVPRPPVVTVMGHVDHGKTKLLDAIRSADVVSGEFGGITQHIGAYMVDTPHGSITFLDTPGHEAFTRMRARGAQVTDIVVLVVAADDGVMPQTIEAINHAKEAEVPIIVAVNKIDKPEANPDRVKSQLSDLGLMPEEWGGKTMFVELSALQKTGIDKLIEAILLEAELLDLKANFRRSAEGKILESRIDHGRGIVATVMVEKGTIAIGDSFVAGIWPGKVRAIFNDKGEKLTHATPSMPVEVLGFEGIPNAGDPLQVVADEKVAREYSSKRQELKRFEDAKNFRKVTVDNLHDMISDGTIQELKVIIKSDVQGSAEALKSSLEKLSTKEIRLHVIQALPGPINEGDVDLAIASKAIIIGFNVRPLPKAKTLAEQEKVDIRKYNVIYKAVEEIHQAMEGMLKPDTREEIIATVEVRNTFKVPKIGTIAGCYVQTGTVKRSASVNVIRAEIVIHSGKIASLKRFKDDAREVAAGYECGIGLEGFDDIQVGDQFEVIEMIEVARKLSAPNSSPAT
jgi:translation initiation factor IF-2